MKNFFENVKARFNKATASVKARMQRTKAVVASKVGEGYIDTAVKIIIGVVIGGVILAGLYTLFNTTVVPNMQTEIGNMFTYSGT
jgi:hypothetical protein